MTTAASGTDAFSWATWVQQASEVSGQGQVLAQSGGCRCASGEGEAKGEVTGGRGKEKKQERRMEKVKWRWVPLACCSGLGRGWEAGIPRAQAAATLSKQEDLDPGQSFCLFFNFSSEGHASESILTLRHCSLLHPGQPPPQQHPVPMPFPPAPNATLHTPALPEETPRDKRTRETLQELRILFSGQEEGKPLSSEVRFCTRRLPPEGKARGQTFKVM